jgi:hypothetical protein
MALSSRTGDRRWLRARTPHDLVAAVPYLIGFHPYDSLVLLGFAGAEVVFTSRADLPLSGRPEDRRDTARHLADIAERQPIHDVVVVGYGPSFHVDPMILETTIALEEIGIGLRAAYRVCGDRLWVYFCDDPECCPPDGVPFDVTSSEVAAAATLAGLVALPDREAFEQLVEADEAATGEAIALATERAEARLRQAFESDDVAGARRLLTRRGERLLDAAVTRYAAGRRLDDDEAAWLSILFLLTDFASLVWERMVRQPVEPYLPIWRDLVRRVQPDLCAPVATLLAYAAWRTGDGALAGLAVRRALRESPEYEPARVIQALLHSGVGPEELTAELRARRSTQRPIGQETGPSDGTTGSHHREAE